MEPGVCVDNMQDDAVACYSNKLEEAEMDGNPVVEIFIARDPCEIEGGGQGTGGV